MVIYGWPGCRGRPQVSEEQGRRIATAWDPEDKFLHSAYVWGDSLDVRTECQICGKVGIEFEGRARRLCDCLAYDKVRNKLSASAGAGVRGGVGRAGGAASLFRESERIGRPAHRQAE